jgi:hypothetical protein
LLKSPDYDDARLSVMLERAKERSQALRQRQRRRQAMIAAAAAAILVAGGTSYGLTARPGGAGHPAGTASELTAVNGCPGLAATSGTLERVMGTSLILKTPGGQAVTVITSPSAKISRQVTGAVSDITDSAHVMVRGTDSSAGIAAERIIIGTLPNLHGPPHARLRRAGPPPPPGHPRSPAQGGRLDGTVTDAGAGSFTVIPPGGFHVRVTTSGSTTVYTQAAAGLGQLQAGQFIVAVGSARADGALAAATVEQGADLPHIQHGNGIIAQPWLGCSPSAVATAAFLAAG